MMMNKKKPFSLHLDVDSFMPATAEEKEVISRMRPSSTFFRDGVKRLLKNSHTRLLQSVTPLEPLHAPSERADLIMSLTVSIIILISLISPCR